MDENPYRAPVGQQVSVSKKAPPQLATLLWMALAIPLILLWVFAALGLVAIQFIGDPASPAPVPVQRAP
ncbi:MAG TPA: hypothetical protein VG826_36085 [Pirellulales bacterium]|nr:hypothetical protein [Pirellulales bacterium]